DGAHDLRGAQDAVVAEPRPGRLSLCPWPDSDPRAALGALGRVFVVHDRVALALALDAVDGILDELARILSLVLHELADIAGLVLDELAGILRLVAEELSRVARLVDDELAR